MTVEATQAEVRHSFAGGGPGAIVSGLVWAAAAVAHTRTDTATAFAVLFFGGMLIFPLSVLICQGIMKLPKMSPDNGLRHLALESTIAMIGLLFAAWLILPFQPDLVFPISAIAVGTHYFAFKTLYGDRTYWVMAALITLAGFAGIYAFVPLPGGVLVTVAAIEIVIGAILTVRETRSPAAT